MASAIAQLIIVNSSRSANAVNAASRQVNVMVP